MITATMEVALVKGQFGVQISRSDSCVLCDCLLLPSWGNTAHSNARVKLTSQWAAGRDVCLWNQLCRAAQRPVRFCCVHQNIARPFSWDILHALCIPLAFQTVGGSGLPLCFEVGVWCFPLSHTFFYSTHTQLQSYRASLEVGVFFETGNPRNFIYLFIYFQLDCVYYWRVDLSPSWGAAPPARSRKTHKQNGRSSLKCIQHPSCVLISDNGNRFVHNREGFVTCSHYHPIIPGIRWCIT